MAAAAPLVPVAIRVTLRPLLIPLAMVAGLVTIYGLVFCIDAIVRGLFGAAESSFAWVPWLGKRVSNGLQRIEQRLTNYLGRLEDQIAAKIGDALHALATGVEHLAQELEESAVALGQLAWLVTSKYSLPALYYRAAKWGVNQAADHLTIRQTKVLVKRVETVIRYPETGKIGAAIKRLTRSVAVEVDALGRAFTGELAGLRARTGELARAHSRLWRWVRKHDKALSTTLLGSVAFAFVARMGGGWIFCRNWKRIGRSVCNTPAGGITWLLGLFALAVAALNVDDVVNIAEDATDELGGIFRAMALPRED